MQETLTIAEDHIKEGLDLIVYGIMLKKNLSSHEEPEEPFVNEVFSIIWNGRFEFRYGEYLVVWNNYHTDQLKVNKRISPSTLTVLTTSCVESIL